MPPYIFDIFTSRPSRIPPNGVTKDSRTSDCLNIERHPKKTSVICYSYKSSRLAKSTKPCPYMVFYFFL